MIVYRIRYQTQLEKFEGPESNRPTKLPWETKESVILTSDDTIDAIEELKEQLSKFSYCGFRVTGMEEIIKVNIIARKKEKRPNKVREMLGLSNE